MGMATDESRSQLKKLFERRRDSGREYIVLTLARVGHAGDADPVRRNEAKGRVGAARTFPSGASRRPSRSAQRRNRDSRSVADGRRWGVRVEVPGHAKGEWRLMIGPVDGATPFQEITTVRVTW